MEATNPSQFCSQCGEKCASEARFCSKCGAKLKKNSAPSLKFTYLTVLGFLFLSGAVWGLVWSAQAYLGGEKPTATFSPPERPASQSRGMPDMPRSNDPLLVELRAVAEKKNDAENWMRLVDTLLLKLEESNEPKLELVFEAISALGNVLEINPHNQKALLQMADLSFSHQAFDKSLAFYQRYLALVPEDGSARARYASTLTFLGNYQQAKEELHSVLKDSPENFHALAYLAIAHSQDGEQSEALEVGLRALEAAPNQETKDRFSSFLDSLVKKENGLPIHP